MAKRKAKSPYAKYNKRPYDYGPMYRRLVDRHLSQKDADKDFESPLARHLLLDNRGKLK